MTLQFLQTTSLVVLCVIALALLQGWLGTRVPARAANLLFGGVFGALGIISLKIPITIFAGVSIGLGPAVIICSTLFGGIASGAVASAIFWGARLLDGGPLVALSGVTTLITWLLAVGILVRRRRRRARPTLLDVLAASAASALIGVAVALAPGSPLPRDVAIAFAPYWIGLTVATNLVIGGILIYFARERVLEAALAESEERYAMLVDASREGMYDRNVVDGTIWFSERAHQIAGLPNGALNGSRQKYLALLHPDEIDAYERTTAETLANRRPYVSRTYRMRRADGTWRWIESHARIVYGDDGTPLRTVGSLADVTDRIDADAALKASEARFSAAFRNSADPMFITRVSDGAHLAANEAAIAMMGWASEELIGRSTNELNIWGDPADRARVREAVLRDGVLRNYPLQLRTKSGAVRDCLLTCSVMATADGPCFLSIVRDVTESLKAERRLAEVHAERDAHLRRLRDIADNLPVLITHTGRDRRVTFVNRTGERWFNLTAADVMGRSRDELLPGFGIAPGTDVIPHVLGGDTARIERSGTYPDGVTRDVEIIYVPDKDDAGRARGYYTLTTDVTERRAQEARLRQAQRMEAVGRLAGGIAHDFNNMLGAIIGFNGFLLEDLPAASPEHRLAVKVAQVCEHAKAVVKQVLDFARSPSVERELVELGDAVEADRILVEGTLPASTRVVLAPPAADLPVLVNKAQLYQVLLNLCKNASDALAGAPGTITIELARIARGDLEFDAFAATGLADDGTARASHGHLADDQAYAMLRVSDTGCGMDQATLERVFEPFFTTKPRSSGTGLGLAVIHGIVASGDGAYRVTSRLGQGSAFSIYLPIAAATAQGRPVVAPPAPRAGGESVLIVDDDADAAEALSIGLERLGYDVTCSSDPLEALHGFEADPGAWDVIITDELMPGMTGSVLAERIKRVRPRCPVILSTGLTGSAVLIGTGGSLDAVIEKPAQPGRIAEVVRRLLDETVPAATAP
jgi:PAS domain S-box-containing protein